MWIAPERRRLQRWIVPAFAAAVGVGVAITMYVRGHPATGLITLAVLFGYAGLLAFRGTEAVLPVHAAYGRSRRGGIHLRAAAMTGDVLVGVIVAALLVQALRGGEILMFAGLAAVAGLTYVISIGMLSRLD